MEISFHTLDSGKLKVAGLLGVDMTDIPKTVTRVEVIDNRGRSYGKHNVNNVSLSLQDDDRTLKIFVEYEDEEEISID